MASSHQNHGFISNYLSGNNSNNNNSSLRNQQGVSSSASTNSFISSEEQKLMMENIVAIFQLEEEEQDEEMRDEGEEQVERVVDLEDQSRRTERLKTALEALGRLWWARSEFVDEITEKLADGSRDPKWRLPLGNSGILDFYLEILNTNTVEHALKIQILRLVGNSCADTDGNRARVVASNYLLPIIAQLSDTSLLPFAIPVLYNICVDYEPAQKLASQSFLTQHLVELISSSRLSDAASFIGYVCKLLDLMIAQDIEKDHAPENTASVLLRIAVSPTAADLEDFLALVTSATLYLQHEKFQQALITYDGLEATLEILVQSYTRFDSPAPGFPSQLDADDAASLTQLRSSLNQALSDVSALPTFAAAVPIQSPISATLRRWLVSPQQQLQICACIILGNIARSDSICEDLVQNYQIHVPLNTIITNASDSQLLHSALGFLKNLALPRSNKPILGDAGLLDTLPRLWALDTLQQIQFSAISLTRQLVISTMSNVRKLGSPLSRDPNSPANSKTKVSLLISLFDRTDIEPTKMEISRLITSICRVYNSYQDPTVSGHSAERLTGFRISFFQRHPDIGRPLAFMVSQTKWPVVRSEGWFVFALMARYPEGAECISEVMHDVKVFQVLVELMTGKTVEEYHSPSSSRTNSNVASPENSNLSTGNMAGSSSTTGSTPLSQFSASLSSNLNSSLQIQQQGQPQPQPPTSTTGKDMRHIDRMNALVLLSELLKNRGDKMAVMRRALFEDLLQGGGEIVHAYNERNGKESSGDGEGGELVKKGKRVVPIEEATKGSELSDLVPQTFDEVI